MLTGLGLLVESHSMSCSERNGLMSPNLSGGGIMI